MSNSRITICDVDLHIDGDGDKPRTVLMLHGWPDDHRLWNASAEVLKRHYRCVRLDLPGFDLSRPPRPTSLHEMSALLHTIVDQISPGKPVTLLMHDWGCLFGYEFAARYPQQVARIVAVDVGDHNSPALRDCLTRKQQLQVFGYQCWLALAWKLGGALGNRMTRWMAFLVGCRAEPNRIHWQMNYPYAMRWFGSYGGFGSARQVDPACPLLFIYGDRKRYNFHSPQWLAAIGQRAGSAALAMPTGHWVMRQKPERFNQAVRDWLLAGDGIAPAPAGA